MLKYGGAAFAADQSSWKPIAAEKTATGYQVAWKLGDTDQYSVWNTDSNGNYTSNALGVVSGASSALKLFETSFQQDLNRDGVISPGGQSTQPPTTPTTGSVTGTSGDNRLTGTSGNEVFKGNGGNDTFAFAANFGNDVITDFGAGRRSHDVVEFSKTVFDDFADVLAHASQSGQDVVIDAGGGNSLTFKNTSLSSLDRSDFHFV